MKTDETFVVYDNFEHEILDVFINELDALSTKIKLVKEKIIELSQKKSSIEIATDVANNMYIVITLKDAIERIKDNLDEYWMSQHEDY